jgi:SAM-dependent methyltransferase
VIAEGVELTAAGLAFDSLAETYDSVFTTSAIGRAQRSVVREHALAAFAPGSHILELNCGTGADALFLANAGRKLTACDGSPGMIRQARHNMRSAAPDAELEFLVLPNEDISTLAEGPYFDGAFSNFSGLNCVEDLSSVSQQLAMRLRPGAPFLMCLSTRYCLWEIGYYLLRGNTRKALRRCRGSSQARVGAVTFPVYYPTLSQLRRDFAPGFRLVSVTGIGVTVPPSYLESWIARHPRVLAWMEQMDSVMCTWPVLRTLGDHMLLQMERVEEC